MAFLLADRVQETTTTTGTGTITLAGAVTNFVTFSSVLSNSDTTFYVIVDSINSDWEVGEGTYSSNTLSRDTVKSSSNAGSLVNFGTGTKTVFISLPADVAADILTAVQPADLATVATSGSYNDLANLPTDRLTTATSFGGDVSGTYNAISITSPLSINTVRLTGTSDASLSSTAHPFQIGPTSGTNVVADGNEIMARNNGATSTLFIQNEGGNASFGGNITVPALSTVDGRDVSVDGAKLDTIDDNANNYTHPNDGGGNQTTLTGALVYDDITINTLGHVTGTSTRSLTATDIGAITGNQTITLTGDVTGSGTTSISCTVANDSHTHAFNNLTGKTAGTGEYATTSNLIAGQGSGSIALTINDGYGNSNLTFNHKNGTPDNSSATQSACRIETSTDSNTGSFSFEIGNSTVQNTPVALTQVMYMTTSLINAKVNLNAEAGLDVTGDITTTGTMTSSVASNDDILRWSSTGYLKRLTTQGGFFLGGDSSGIVHAGDQEAGLRTALGITDATTSENLYHVADGNVQIRTNWQDVGNSNDKTWTFEANGDLTVPGNVDGRDLATDGAKLDASTTSATADTLVERNGSRDIFARLFRSDYTNQTTISGAIAYRVNTSDNYIRFCSDTGAIRTFLGVDAAGTNNYTHPSHPGDDFSVDTGALTGATVVSDIDINVTTDALGHVTDANGTVDTRVLTVDDLSATGVQPTARGMGWEGTYGAASAAVAENAVTWDNTEKCLAIRSDQGDTSIGAAYRAVYAEAGATVRWTVTLKGSAADTDGLYLRLYGYTGTVLSDGKTHVSNSSANGSPFVAEETAGNQDTGWYENGAVPSAWTTFERSWTVPATGYYSLVILNWSGFSGTIYVRQPDVSLVKPANAVSADSATTATNADSASALSTANTGSVQGSDLRSDRYIYSRNDTDTYIDMTIGGSDTTRMVCGNGEAMRWGTSYTRLQDGITLRFGGSNDNREWWDGPNNIKYDRTYTHGGRYYWQMEDSGGVNHAMIYMYANNTAPYVSLFGDGSEKLKTTTSGIDVTGAVTADNFISGGIPFTVGYGTGASDQRVVQSAGTFAWYNSTGTSTMTLDNSGNLTAAANITAYSDERLKDNIETLDGSKVYEMRGVSFTKDGAEGSGVIAQELEKVAPELVHDDGEYKSVAYGNLVGYLIEAVKEQQAQIKALEAKLEALT